MSDQNHAPTSTPQTLKKIDDVVFVVCPYGGSECARVPLHLMGESWASDYIDVHVKIHHKPWPVS